MTKEDEGGTQKPTREDIQEFFDDFINPALEAHGGALVIEDYDQILGELKVSMHGGCHGCMAAAETLTIQIAQALKEEFSGIESIEDITDHSTGANPYIGRE